ncbi:hypothetical protein [Streptomyces roseirectus]|uniref:hypothetical protein n=1 Tax=Streptomyces roseirectus TaxID=2768066 RepID=UPI001FE398DC|nr:hypothetical protein [Streptomyces roseirectus]
MTQEAVVRSARHADWWAAPLIATLFGLPLLVWEFSWQWANDGTELIFGAVYWGFGLWAVSWLLPHRVKYRRWRAWAAFGTVGIGALPLMFALLLGLAMST